jgi:L-alanine-DL-glutamate epimerase-like enolase superfamily enzyme
MPNAFLVEFIDWTPPDLFVGMPKCEGGAFHLSARPGHGIDLAPDAAEKYRL